jgi:hypothetical protein
MSYWTLRDVPSFPLGVKGGCVVVLEGRIPLRSDNINPTKEQVMNLISTFGNAPKYVVIVLVVLTFVFGSHAALDTLVAKAGGKCIPVDADTSVCLVKDTAE